MVEASIDAIETALDAIETAIDAIETAIDAIEARAYGVSEIEERFKDITGRRMLAHDGNFTVRSLPRGFLRIIDVREVVRGVV